MIVLVDFLDTFGAVIPFGNHLHLALRLNGTPIDPMPYIREGGRQ